ncbi:peptide ABC transporter substrate-binding protein [Streptobacillus felis]|uniref:Peptide ABC transporter substrate-binding protein n=1 Tax=Streptobacillus felis TaxID=1384509 RepID=A0A7Z0TA42_9FUSO|nr:peptide ABC transporter substrate-binding protein [Streptobacillus felis]NYV27592.1 peptide ABC transporter substrate-binding protein [Streptobacillus felis]
MKKIVRSIIYVFVFISFFISCGKEKINDEDKVLVYNLFSAPRTLDPHKYNDNISMQISNSIYEGLLRFDDKGEIIGGLAKSYLKEGNKYSFELRDNLKYSDGSDIKVEDVEASLLRALDKEFLSQFASQLFVIKNAKEYYEGKVSRKDLGIKVENNLLVIELEKDYNYFPYLMTLPITAPFKEGKYNGPYKLELQTEQEVLVSKNDNYWRSSEVHVDRIKYVYFKDFSVVNNLIKNEDIDISRVDVELLNKNINSYFDGRIWYLDYNLINNEMLKNIHLRKAISLAIDRNIYMKIKNDGSKVALNLINEIFEYIPTYTIEDVNVELANFELELAKKELGVEKFNIELLSGNTPIEVKEIQFIQEQLKQNLGIEVSVKTVPYSDRLALIKDNKYDIALNTWSAKYKDPLAILDRFQFKNKKIEVFELEKYKEILEEARIFTLDRKEKIALAEQMLLENLIVSPLYFSIENKFVSDRVTSIVNNPIGNVTDLSYARWK